MKWVKAFEGQRKAVRYKKLVLIEMGQYILANVLKVGSKSLSSKWII